MRRVKEDKNYLIKACLYRILLALMNHWRSFFSPGTEGSRGSSPILWSCGSAEELWGCPLCPLHKSWEKGGSGAYADMGLFFNVYFSSYAVKLAEIRPAFSAFYFIYFLVSLVIESCWFFKHFLLLNVYF